MAWTFTSALEQGEVLTAQEQNFSEVYNTGDQGEGGRAYLPCSAKSPTVA